LHTSAKGAAFIAAHEGVVTRAYRDVAGVLTIGVGHTAAAGPPTPKPGMTITRGTAFDILHRDLERYERRVAEALPGVDQHVFDGAVSFDFNTGAIDRATWVRRFRAGDRDGARAGLTQWIKAGGRTVPGLKRRRAAEARLIFSGAYGPESSGTAPRVAASRSPAEVREVQSALIALGFYDGAVDGIAGRRTKAAVRAYQEHHPDLVADGIAGPATRASLAREQAARARVTQTVGGALGTAAAGAAATVAGGGPNPLAIAALVGIAVLILLGGAFAWAYRGELNRLIKTRSRPMRQFLSRAWRALKGWKTILVSLAIAVAGVLQTADWATIVPASKVGPTMLVIAVLVAVLRTITSTPVGRSDGR